LHVPETGNRRHAGRVERRGGEALRLKGIRTPAGADVLALETPILERRLEPGSVLWIAQHERSVRKLTGRRRHPVVAVVEGALHGRAISRDLEPERDCQIVDADGRVPDAGQYLRPT